MTEEAVSHTLYDILGVEPNAPVQKIRTLYRLKSQAAHPDRRSGDMRLQQQLNQAYAILKDPEKRREYNDQIGLRAQPRPLKPGRPSYQEIVVRRQDAHQPIPYSFKRWEPCHLCWGEGCARCRGKGKTLETIRLTVTIPAGVSQTLVTGQGTRTEPGGKRGDLVLYVIWT